MKHITIKILLLAAIMPLFASCDDHVAIDTSTHIGHILCDDHRTLSLEAYKAQMDSSSSVNAVAVVFALENEQHGTLAVMLDEIPHIAFADSLMSLGTSCDVSAYDGYKNSVSMCNTYDSRTGHGSPLGRYVFSSHTFGQSDFIPSCQEARLLHSQVYEVNRVIRELQSLGVSADEISTTSAGGACWYWTSTEDASDKNNRSWLCSMATGGIQQTPKTEHHSARAIVELNY